MGRRDAAQDPGGSGRRKGSTRRANGGFALLPFIAEPPPAPPATNAGWAWSLRRFARGASWLLPGYALLSGIVSVTDRSAAGTAQGLLDQPLRLLGWLAAVWLGLLALSVLAALLAATRSRRSAVTALLAGLAGAVLTLPFAVLPAQSSVGGTDAGQMVVLGGAVYSGSWLLAGWAVARSRMLNVADGCLLMVAAPLLGLGGLLSGFLQTLGAVLTLAAGIGVAWRAGRLVPRVGRADQRPAATGAVAAAVATGGTPGAP